MDSLQKLLFSQANARGETVVVEDSFLSAIEHQHLPLAVQRLAGEVTAAALLSAAAISYDGTVILQIEGDGPVKLLIVEVQSDLTYRLSVTLRERKKDCDPNAQMKALINENGKGRCALILDPNDRPQGVPPYQGVVSLEGDTFAQVMEHYFEKSEQVPTQMVLTSDDKRAAGILLQKLPTLGGQKLPDDYDETAFDRLKMFLNTVKSEELLTLSPEEINRRLFWEESPRVLLEATPSFKCRCSDEAVKSMIRSLGKDEAQAIVKEEGAITVTCHFCGKVRSFDPIDVETLFSTQPVQEGSKGGPGVCA